MAVIGQLLEAESLPSAVDILTPYCLSPAACSAGTILP